MSGSYEGFERAAAVVAAIRAEMAKNLVGKRELVDAILVCAASGGHLLVEGPPGLAKTLAARSYAEASGLSCGRVQFTPDLLPSDLVGSLVFNQADGSFAERKGPVFAQVLIADEINRAPAKVQSALLEAMEEGRVTIGEKSHGLPRPFLVLATQNPIEHEGTYPLPEAQLDRFLLKTGASYPDATEEEAIALKGGLSGLAPLEAVADAASVRDLAEAAAAVEFGPKLLTYCVALVRATRPGEGGSGQDGSEIGRFVELGSSPRGSIALYRAAKAGALLEGRRYAGPDDVKRWAPAALRHRIKLSYEAEAEGVDADRVIRRLLETLPLP